MNKKEELQYYENIINFLKENYTYKKAELKRYSKWFSFIQRKMIQKQLNETLADISYYKKLIKEYKSKGYL
jgi:hypothetical protein